MKLRNDFQVVQFLRKIKRRPTSILPTLGKDFNEQGEPSKNKTENRRMSSQLNKDFHEWLKSMDTVVNRLIQRAE